VTSDGKVIEASKIRKDSKVRVHYVKQGDDMLVDKVIITDPATKPFTFCLAIFKAKLTIQRLADRDCSLPGVLFSLMPGLKPNRSTFVLVAIIAFAGCNRAEVNVSRPLRQRGYIWQREWTPAVIDSLGEAARRMDGVVILGAEISFAEKKPEIIKASIDWEVVKRQAEHCSVALRVAPFAGPFRADDGPARTIVGVTKDILDDARAHDVKIEEFQFDFDCAQKNLGSYRAWLQALRPAIRPSRFVITTLPAWLESSEFLSLVRETDGYVLQVHSIPISSGSAKLCDVRLAREWAAKAAKLGLSFSVALPTYRGTAGYGPDGKLLSVAMDSVQPSWPPGTRILEFGADADEIAGLVRTWQKARPTQLRELLWYRIPTATDTRNWRWVTLSAVLAGRRPEHKLRVLQEGANPIDLSILNAGEADEQLNSDVMATWKGAGLDASDALSGWSVRSENGRAVFQAIAQQSVRLPPGAIRKIGWLRFDQPTSLRIEFSNQNESLH
jgi:hypothetical protein